MRVLVTSAWDGALGVWEWKNGESLALCDNLGAVADRVIVRSTDNVVVCRDGLTVYEWAWHSGGMSRRVGCADVMDIVAERRLWACVNGGELAIKSRNGNHVIARWPYMHSRYASHPTRPLWVGIKGGRPEVIELQGEPQVSPVHM
jgi:hypothetical protein